jgi:FeS assembly protein IscX
MTTPTRLGWDDLEALVPELRQAHPRVDPRAMSDDELRELARGLDNFDPGRGDGTPGDFEALRAMWHWGV